MPKTWKGKTRGGTFRIHVLHLHDSLSGYHCGLRLSVIGRPLFYTFRTESYRQYLAIRTEQTEIRTAESRRTVLEKLLPTGQILIDKVAIGNGMADKYHFELRTIGIFRRTEWKHRRNYDRRPCR